MRKALIETAELEGRLLERTSAKVDALAVCRSDSGRLLGLLGQLGFAVLGRNVRAAIGACPTLSRCCCVETIRKNDAGADGHDVLVVRRCRRGDLDNHLPRVVAGFLSPPANWIHQRVDLRDNSRDRSPGFNMGTGSFSTGSRLVTVAVGHTGARARLGHVRDWGTCATGARVRLGWRASCCANVKER